jgi:hypothetical protein
VIRLTNGENVKWREGDGWETGNVVREPLGATVTRSSGAVLYPADSDAVLVALTFGGLAFVEYSRLQPIPNRSEWEKAT